MEEASVKCPYCGVESLASVLKEQKYCLLGSTLYTVLGNGRGGINFDEKGIKFHGYDIQCRILKCANTECLKSSLWIVYYDDKGKKQEAKIVPKSNVKFQPEYIPENIRSDYIEACLILEDSPNASAALARRCLQGMIRDFWGVKEKTLYQEIDAITDKVEPTMRPALLGLKDIGNIGAHPHLIVDVSKDDANNLVRLLEILFKLWYVDRHDTEELLSQIPQRSNQKKKEEQEGTTS